MAKIDQIFKLFSDPSFLNLRPILLWLSYFVDHATSPSLSLWPCWTCYQSFFSLVTLLNLLPLPRWLSYFVEPATSLSYGSVTLLIMLPPPLWFCDLVEPATNPFFALLLCCHATSPSLTLLLCWTCDLPLVWLCTSCMYKLYK